MNLSQDEIEAMMAGNAAEAPAAAAEPDTSGDIMSPEAIAAMLDSAAGGVDPIPADEPAADTSGDIMSPEAIAAMLDDAAGGVEATPEEEQLIAQLTAETEGDALSAEMIASLLDSAEAGELDTGGELMSPEAIAAMMENPPTASEGVQEDPLANAPVLEGMLTDDEVDILGEIGNISMGAVATTMYTLLDRRVSITTPRVYVFESKDVLSIYKVPFVVATIEYTRGISGTNLLVLKIEDAALITDLLMGGDGTVEEPIELNEMHLSAMSEIMNQMMGASSTSLAKLLGTPIDIAPPKSSTVDAGFDVKSLLGNMDKVTKIAFDMEIEGLLKSELIQLVPYEESRKFAKQFNEAGLGDPPATAAPAAAAAPPPPPAAAPPPPPAAAAPQQAPPPPPAAAAPQQAPPPMQPYPQQPPMGADPYAQQPYPQAPYPQMPYPQAPYPQMPYQQPPMAGQGRVVDVHPMQFQAFDAHGPAGEPKSIDLVYNIPLQVSVELGRAKKEISEILEFNLGTIIVLDKIAGDPVEIVVNGKMIARGEVVVIDDNYGVRITDIING